ncbi:MAG: gamma-glutamyl-gamma-aminobutyrate hydrolase family protein [Chloroflexi bacterium]|nr:gamma-glutamyl-gamma-aminobutyrate hydrolase family protein [Chloroflexota bacterium]
MTSSRPSSEAQRLKRQKQLKRPLIGCATYRKRVDQLDIVGINEPYTQAVIAAGGIPVLIPLCLDADDWRRIYDQVDGLLLPGGGDIEHWRYSEELQAELRGIDPDRDELELALARTAVAEQKPLLAICRGHQVLNVALGGALWQDVSSQMSGAVNHDFRTPYPRNHIAHMVEVAVDSKLARYLPGRTAMVNSIHHQGVRDLASGLVATAWAEDGLIEGIEAPDCPFAIGVQWHPEGLYEDDSSMLALFEGLVNAAANGNAPR